MIDPEEHALVVKALTSGLSNCVSWDEKAARRVMESGLNPRSIKSETIDLVKSKGPSVLIQKPETRDPWKDNYRFYYKVILPSDVYRGGLFVEMILTDDDREFPVVVFVNSHP